MMIELPIPRDWQDFEDFCRDLFAAEWDDPHTQKHGRPGQADNGVDVYGRREGRWQGVQCKLRRRFPVSKLTNKEIEQEIKAAQEFHSPLESLVIATTAPTDAKNQAVAAELTSEVGFRVAVYSWSALCERLEDHPKVLTKWQRRLGSPRELVWYVPHRRNLYFTGRSDVLETLQEALTREGSAALGQAISGLGGIGKTQTAVEYAYRYRAEYETVLWTRAETEQELVAGFAELAGVLDLPEKDAQEQDLAVKAVQRWLEKHDSWLLVLDNADTPEIVEPFLPTAPRGHILLTSRAQNFALLDIEPVRLPTLQPDDAVTFLLNRAGRKDPATAESKAAQKLAEELGYLPLALEQAVAYITDRGSHFEDYLQSYRRRRLELLAKGQPRPDYPESVSTTWSMNFEQVEVESAASAEILRLSAFLAPDSIPLEILMDRASQEFPHNTPKNLKPLTWLQHKIFRYWLARQRSSRFGKILSAALVTADEDPAVIDDLLRPLMRFSLIERAPKERTFRVHQIVQEVVRNALARDMQLLWKRRCIQAVDWTFPSVEFETWPLCERLSAHAETLLKAVDVHSLKSRAAGRLLNQAGLYLYARGRYREAAPYSQLSVLILEKVLRRGHPAIAESLDTLANLYNAQGEYDQALPLFQRSLKIRETALGKDHSGIAGSLNNLAKLHYNLGEYDQTLPLFKRSLGILEKAYGDEHPAVAMSLNNLALVYRAQGDFDMALPLFQRSLKTREEMLGKEHPDVAHSLHNLAGLYRFQGEFDQALPLFQRSLKISQKVLGDGHPDVAVGLSGLAHLHRDLGEYDQALPLFERSLKIFEKVLGEEHPDVALVLENLAALLRAMEPSQERETQIAEMEARAKTIREKRG